MAADITPDELQNLLNQGLPQNEIARRTGIPRSTLRRRLKELSTPKETIEGTPIFTFGVPTPHDQSIPNVYYSTPLPIEDTKSWDEFRELLAWWRERKALHTEADTEQETERKTYHVQKRYIEAIQRAADLEHVSITEIVNRAFAHYFNRAHE